MNIDLTDCGIFEIIIISNYDLKMYKPPNILIYHNKDKWKETWYEYNNIGGIAGIKVKRPYGYYSYRRFNDNGYMVHNKQIFPS